MKGFPSQKWKSRNFHFCEKRIYLTKVEISTFEIKLLFVPFHENPYVVRHERGIFMYILKRKKSFLLCKGRKVEICNFYLETTFSQKWKSRKVRGNIRISMLFMSLQLLYFMFYLIVIKV